MKLFFWRSESTVKDAQDELFASCVDLERTRLLQKDSAVTAKRLQALGESNGFTEAIALLYANQAK